MPTSQDEHGGGFVFDCRCVPNPGREKEFAPLTGLHEPVKLFLDKTLEAKRFYELVEELVINAAEIYNKRGFTSLSIAFGCTGGQHRSVYFAKKLAENLSLRNDVSVELTHRDMPII